MKRLMLTALALPLLAGCWWNKQDNTVVETTTMEQMTDDTVPASEIPELLAEESDDNVEGNVAGDEISDEDKDEK